jgi:large subunit ribosomal protein L35Ae
MNCRIGVRTQTPHECLIQFDNVGTKAQAGKFIGQKVLWKSGNSRLGGQIIGFHGRKGVVVAKFKKGVPGQAIGIAVELIS